MNELGASSRINSVERAWCVAYILMCARERRVGLMELGVNMPNAEARERGGGIMVMSERLWMGKW